MRVAVIGIGGVGSAACRHLAKAGHTVVGFEQFAIGHRHGSSHGESRIIRYAYPDLLYTQMMRSAYDLWRDLQVESVEELLVPCGGLLIGRPENPLVVQTTQALRESATPFETLSPQQSSQRFEAIALQPHEIALYQPDAGYLRSSRCVLANVRSARAHGAQIFENTEVTEIVERDGQAAVRLASHELAVFDGIIVTAGAWSAKLLPHLKLPLRVGRRQVIYLQIQDHYELFAVGKFPVWIDAETLYYGFPADGQIAGIKLASHTLGPDIDPDSGSRAICDAITADAVAQAKRRLRYVGATVEYAQTCLYTSTSNEDFILDFVPNISNVCVVSACSGHGFKFTVLMGKICAMLVTGGDVGHDLSRFKLSAAR